MIAKRPTKPFPIFAFLALMAGGIAIGFAGIFMRMSDVSPVASAFWRMALALPPLWLWAYAVRGRDLKEGRRIEFVPVLALVGVFFAADMSIWHMSLHYTTVANATLLANFAPVFIAFWMWLVHRVRSSRIFVIGMAIALGGAFMLIAPKSGGHTGENKLLGDFYGIVAAVCYAAYQLAIKNARDQFSAARLMAVSTTVTAIALLPFALLAPGAFWPAQAAGWIPLILLAFLAQIAGQTVIAYAFAHLPASLASVSLLIQPLTAAIAAWLLFTETMGSLQIVGAVLVLLGIYLCKRGSRH